MHKVGCREAAELLLDFLEEALAPETAQGLRKHFQDCKPCLSFLESYRKTPDLCRQALLHEIPEDVSARLLSFLRKRARCDEV